MNKEHYQIKQVGSVIKVRKYDSITWDACVTSLQDGETVQEAMVREYYKAIKGEYNYSMMTIYRIIRTWAVVA